MTENAAFGHFGSFSGVQIKFSPVFSPVVSLVDNKQLGLTLNMLKMQLDYIK